jgi:hypothetical protein
MNIEKNILACIKEHPGISAKKIVSCMDSKAVNLSAAEETSSKISIFKQLRRLKRNRNVHNRGDRWYAMNPIEENKTS